MAVVVRHWSTVALECQPLGWLWVALCTECHAMAWHSLALGTECRTVVWHLALECLKKV